MPKKIRLKVSIIGPPKSGKTSFINNLLQKPVGQTYTKTQCYQLSLYTFKRNRIEYQIQLWQCGVQHRQYNKHIRQAFFKNASAAFLMFDLNDSKWKNSIQEWLLQAYQFDCFLVYAIGTKKDLLFKKKYEEKYGRVSVESNTLSEELLTSKGVETLDQLDINKFFQQFQIKHFFQSAFEPFHKSIKNIFVGIENDQQRVTRSSLAVGRRFDNTVIDLKSEQKQGGGKEEMEGRGRHQFLGESVKMQQIQQMDEKEEESKGMNIIKQDEELEGMQQRENY